MKTPKHIKKYLPSKKFIKIGISFIVVGIILFFILNFVFSKKSFFTSSPNDSTGKIGVDRLAILKMTQKDSDGDGVPDWEESLWGTDPKNPATFQGISDKTYIESKKKELNGNKDTGPDSGNLTETEKFAREFFSTYVAMKTSGQTDDTTINNFSSYLGDNIANPILTDRYTEANLTIDNSNNGAGDSKKYFSELKKIFDTYRDSGIGEELSIMDTGLASGGDLGEDSVTRLSTIANLYKDFTEKASKIPVPKNLVTYDLKMLNDGNNTGISVLNMTKISTDPIIGLGGVTQYQKYSSEFVNSSQELETKALD